MDVGTAYEIGYASAKGKLIVGCSADDREHSIVNNLAALHSDLRDNAIALDFIGRVVAIYRSRSLAVGRRNEA